MIEYDRHEGESLLDYFVRLFENRGKYGLTCVDVAQLLNDANGVNYDESKWRKDWRLFNAGRIYEQRKADSNIATRILCISDLHVPYQLPIQIFQDYVGRVDLLVINGDVSDCQAISRFPKLYRNSPIEELIQTRSYLIDLINYIAPKRVITLYGNHDVRFQSYLSKNIDTDLLELMPRTSLELIFADGFHHYDKRSMTKTWYAPLCDVLDDVEVEYVDNWWAKYGDTIFCHPLAFSSGTMKTAEKALAFFRNEGIAFRQIVVAHTHRVGYTKSGNTTVVEQGCCCQTSEMNYSNGKLTPSQKEGFYYFGQDAEGNTIPQSCNLVNLN